MTLAAVMSGTAASPGGTLPTSGLQIDALDVLHSGGTSRYGTDPATIDVDEASPGQASSIGFTVDDPALELTITEGQEVLFLSHRTGLPYFRGYVTVATERVVGLGREWDVQAIGVEKWLDWLKLTADVAIVGPVQVDAAILTVAAAVRQPNPLRVIVDPTGSSGGSQAAPTGWIAGTGGAYANRAQILATLTITAGTTLREALRMLSDVSVAPGWVKGAGTKPFFSTVDPYMGLRVFAITPSDWTTLVVSDTSAGLAASEPTYTRDATGVARGIQVKGVNPAASGTFDDGTGLPGDYAFVSDATILTADQAEQFARSYLTRTGVVGRGLITLEDYAADPMTFHAGGQVTVTDAQLGLAARTDTLGNVERRFNRAGVATVWTRYGGPRPSAMAAIRRLSRTVLS